LLLWISHENINGRVEKDNHLISSPSVASLRLRLLSADDVNFQQIFDFWGVPCSDLPYIASILKSVIQFTYHGFLAQPFADFLAMGYVERFVLLTYETALNVI
jgi:hypothetical protein